MSGINPISGIRPPMISPAAGGVHQAQSDGGVSKFAQALKEVVGSVDQTQQSAGSAVRDLVSGRSDDILPVVSAVAKADLSFKLLVGVRNKVIEAYKQTMNMQI